MDGQIWFYIIAAVIYFLTRKKKKPADTPSTPNTSSSERPTQQKKPVSFEDLLKEITDQRETEEPELVIEEKKPEPKPIPVSAASEPRARKFADDESRRIYEQSIIQADSIDNEFKPDKDYASKKLFKGSIEPEEPTIADEIREGLNNTDSARKAIIYAEILQRKY